MPDGLTVRDARDEERGVIHDLTLRAYAEYASVMEPAAWRALERAVRAALVAPGPVERIVAERDGALVGSVMLFPPASDAYGALTDRATAPELRLLAVAREARGTGVGEVLVRECARRARAAGATELGLHTSTSMATARRMYERLGFVRAPEHDFTPAGAEVVEAFRLVLG